MKKQNVTWWDIIKCVVKLVITNLWDKINEPNKTINSDRDVDRTNRLRDRVLDHKDKHNIDTSGGASSVSRAGRGNDIYTSGWKDDKGQE